MYTNVHIRRTTYRPRDGLEFTSEPPGWGSSIPPRVTMDITEKDLLIALGFLISLCFGFFVYPKLAARQTMRKFGLVPVQNSNGDEIYAVEGPDGEPIKVPVQRTDKDGKVTVEHEFVPLAYALPVIAAVQTKAFLTSTIQGKAGKYKQMADAAVLAEMPLEQAASAMALEAFARGQYGKALMAYLTPRIAAAINASSAAGKAAEQSGNPKGSDWVVR